MIKKIIFIFILIFSQNLLAGNEILKEQDILCKTEIKTTAEIITGLSNENTLSKDLIDGSLAKSFIKSANACSNQILVNNLPNNVMYYMFGEPYGKILNISLFITNNVLRHIINTVNKALPADYRIYINELEFIPAFNPFTSLTFLSLASIISSLVFAGLLAVCVFTLIKLVYDNMKGNYDKDFIVNFRRLGLAFTLLTPLPFFDYINVIMAVVLMIVSFAIMVGNAFFMLAYLSLYSIDANNATTIYKDEIIGKNYVAILDNERFKMSYDGLINSQYQIIETLEKDISKNLPTSNLVKFNQDLDFNTNPNFFNCLFNETFIGTNRLYDKTRTQTFNVVNVCATIHHYFYDTNLRKFPMLLSEVYKDTGKYQVIDFDQNQKTLMTKLENDTLYIAQQLYYYNCQFDKQFNIRKVNRTFECVKFNGIGQYRFEYLTDLDKYEVEQTGNFFGLKNGSDERRTIIDLKQRFYSEGIAAAKNLFIKDDEINETVSNLINGYVERQLFTVIKGGFFSGYSLLMPKAEVNISFYKESLTKIAFGLSGYSNIENNNEVNHIEENYRSFENTFYSFNTENKAFNSETDYLKTNYRSLLLEKDYISKDGNFSQCLLERKCDYIMPTNLITHYFIVSSNLLDLATTGTVLNELMAKLLPTYKIAAYSAANITLNLMYATGFTGYILIPTMFILFFVVFCVDLIYRWLRAFILCSIIVPRMIFLPKRNQEEHEDFNATEEEKLLITYLREIFFSPIFLTFAAVIIYIVIWLIAAGNSFLFAYMMGETEFSGIKNIDIHLYLLLYYITVVIILCYGLIQYFKIYNKMCSTFNMPHIHPSEDLQKLQNIAVDLVMGLKPR